MAAENAATASAPRERRNRQDEVLEAAIEIFHRRGYAAASIQEVADHVGVLKGSLYYYIDSKEDLLARIFAESDRQVSELMEEIAKLDAPGIERLRAFFEAWSLWYLANVERASLYFSEWRHLTGKRLESVIAERHRYEQYVAGLIDEAKRDGDADPNLDTRYTCFFILSATNGLSTWYKREGPDPPEHIAVVYADMIVELVRNTKGRKKPSKTRGKSSRS
ncbi:MAG: TetR/AcrR family transcriptional regulator [Solirubrobacterales bacterium]|jgi:AcrR family transcriptional regulator|nr:TetR/AcrR family transcriptional regulator [Solirubrobacterales bacterium]